MMTGEIHDNNDGGDPITTVTGEIHEDNEWDSIKTTMEEIQSQRWWRRSNHNDDELDPIMMVTGEI